MVARHSERVPAFVVIDYISMTLLPLGPIGTAVPTVSCALAYVLNGYDGRSGFIRVVLDMNGDHFVRMSSNLFETPVLSYLLLFIGTESALWHVAALFCAKSTAQMALNRD